MSFAAPLYLLALTALPLLVLAYILLDRRRALVQSRFASPALFPELVARPPGLRRHPCKPRRLQRQQQQREKMYLRPFSGLGSIGHAQPPASRSL